MSEFGTLNLEEIQGEDSRLNTEVGEGFLDKFVPMPEVKPGQTGVVAVRILPPVKGGKLFQYTRLHLINGRKVHCPKPLVNGKWDKNTPCPICDYYNALWRNSDKLEERGRKAEAEKLQNEARSIKPIERYYYNAIVRKLVSEKGEELNVGPRILSVGKVLHKMIVRAIVGDETEAALGDITHPKNGYDFIIKKELRGTGDNAYPNYDRSAFARESSPLGSPEDIARWVANLHDLTQLRTLVAFDKLEHELAVHRGLVPDEKESFDIDSFDAKFKGGTKTSVSVPSNMNLSDEDAVANVVGGGAAAAESTSAPAEDVNIEDAEFLKELQDMG